MNHLFMFRHVEIGSSWQAGLQEVETTTSGYSNQSKVES